MSLSINKFLSFLQQHNIPTDEDIVFGKLTKYDSPVNRKPKRAPSEWYIAFEIGNEIWARCGSFTSDENQVFKSWDSKELDPELHALWKAAQEEAKEEYKKVEAEKIIYAKQCTQHYYDASVDIPDNFKFEYLEKKQLPPQGLRYFAYEDCLILFYKNNQGELVAAQRFYRDGTKKTVKATSLAKGYVVLGHVTPHMLVSESWSSGLTCQLATGKGVLVTGGSSNVITTTALFRSQYPNVLLELAQDNDGASDKVTDQWKTFIKTEIYTPSERDFNEVLLKHGMEEVKRQLKPKRFPTQNAQQRLLTPKPPITWCVEDMIMEGSIVSIIAAAGVGKSMISLLLAYCLGHQIPFMDRYVPNAQKVLYIDGELGHTLLDYMTNLVIGGGPYPYLPDSMSTLVLDDVQPRPTISSLTDQAVFDKDIAEHDVIILDNYLSLTDTADTNEQHHGWRTINNWLRPWARNNKKTFIIINHTTKNKEVMRGPVEMNNDLDTTIILTPDTEAKDHFSVNVAFGDKRRGVHPRKQKPWRTYLLDKWYTEEIIEVPKPNKR